MRIVTSENVREQMLEGMKLVADTVSKTMWPKGRNVAIDNGGIPVFTNDWVSVAREIFSEDKIQNIGTSMIKEACERTNKEAGDGTTTTAVLTYAIAKEGIKYISKGMNPFALSKGLQEVGQHIIEIVRSQGKQLETKEEIQQIASISAQDEEIGTLIADIMDEVGNDWTITVEEWQTAGITMEIKKWLQFDTGYISPYMANKEDNSYQEQDVAILVTDIIIEKFSQIRPILEKLLKLKEQKLVIICPDMEGEALASVSLNKVQGKFDCVAIRAPGYWPILNKMLEDIAIVTGAQLVTQETGQKLEDIETSVLWTILKIKSTPNNTILTQDESTKWAIEDRINRIRIDISSSDNEFLKTKHQERLSKLAWGIGIIRVWAPTKMEMLQKKFKIEDALNATRSAIQEWIVDWWGNALAWVKLPKQTDNMRSEYREIAKEILIQAIKYPHQNIIRNAWYDPDKVEKEQPIGLGFDSNLWLYVNMVETGIIDPIKVIRVALENAISSATMLLTTEATITDVPDRLG